MNFILPTIHAPSLICARSFLFLKCIETLHYDFILASTLSEAKLIFQMIFFEWNVRSFHFPNQNIQLLRSLSSHNSLKLLEDLHQLIINFCANVCLYFQHLSFSICSLFLAKTLLRSFKFTKFWFQTMAWASVFNLAPKPRLHITGRARKSQVKIWA